MSIYTVGYLIGSLARGSINRLLARALARLGVLSFCNSPQMNAPEAYIQFTSRLITADGSVTNDSTAEFLRRFMQELHTFIVRVYTVLPRSSVADADIGRRAGAT